MKPIILAMIICDYYYRDAGTGKSVIAGTFSTINSPLFPSKHGNCAVYIALTDVAQNGKLQLVFRKEGGPFKMELPPWDVTRPDDRRTVIEIGGNINGLPLPEEGFYEFAVLWDSHEIFTRRLLASKVNMTPAPDPANPANDGPALPD
jgi:hypothetical protein